MSSGVIASTGQASTHASDDGSRRLYVRLDAICAGLDPRARLTAFVPRDPDEAGCVIEVRA